MTPFETALRDLIRTCEQAAVREAEDGMQADTPRYAAYQQALAFIERYAPEDEPGTIALVDAAKAIAEYTPPTIDLDDCVPGSRTVERRGKVSEWLAVRKRPQTWRGAEVGGGFELVRGWASYSTRGGRERDRFEFISRHASFADAVAALENAQAVGDA